jgi:nitrite reductase/ring-hydroxylating ferredoxin subunit
MRQLSTVAEIPLPGVKEVFVPSASGGFYLMLTRSAAGVRAFHNECPHAGRPLNYAPNQFLLSPLGNVVCAVHGAEFVLDSGECVAGPCFRQSLRAFPVQVIDEVVYLA